MGWRDEYQQAKWRGVPFYVRRAESEYGRRVQQHSFPNKDVPETEDLGRRPRSYRMEGYLLGDDFYTQKDTMLRAVEAHGPGLLVHPYYGELFVTCVRCRVTDTDKELGITRLNFEFQEQGVNLLPKAVPNPKALANSVKTGALSAINDAFLKAYSIVNKPFAEVQKLITAVEQGIALTETVRRSVGNVASFQRQVISMGDSVTALINNAADLGTESIGVLTFGTFPFDGEVRVDADSAKQMFDEMGGLFGGSGETPSDDSSPVKAYNDLMTQASTVTAGGLIPEVEFESLEDLEASALVVLDQIDAIEEAGVEDNAVLTALRETRVVIRNDVEDRADRLSRTSEVVLPETLPAVVLSNNLYGDIDQESSILTRNHIDHPGFVDGRRPIKVLISA
jgi:prophage DNA circulation protein